jgi:hypothetical protein
LKTEAVPKPQLVDKLNSCAFSFAIKTSSHPGKNKLGVLNPTACGFLHKPPIVLVLAVLFTMLKR